MNSLKNWLWQGICVQYLFTRMFSSWIKSVLFCYISFERYQFTTKKFSLQTLLLWVAKTSFFTKDTVWILYQNFFKYLVSSNETILVTVDIIFYVDVNCWQKQEFCSSFYRTADDYPSDKNVVAWIQIKSLYPNELLIFHTVRACHHTSSSKNIVQEYSKTSENDLTLMINFMG